MKYNISTGDTDWVRKDTGIYSNGEAYDIIVDTMGNTYISGTTSNSGSGAAVDIMVIKYSDAGSLVWQVNYNGPFSGVDLGRAISVDNLSNIFVLGYSQSAAQISDYVVIKYNQLVGINPVNNEIPFLYKLEQNYPNPFNSSSKFRIQNPKMNAVNVIIYDVLGREVGNPVNETLKPGIYEVGIDGTNYPSGVYFYRMTADKVIVDTKKLVIIK